MLFEREQQLNRIEQRQVTIEQKVDKIMAAQDDINAAVTALNSFLSDLSADVTAIQAELAAGGTAVDTSALNTVVGQLPAAQSAIDALAHPAATSASPVAGQFRA
jgi:chromosome segregation ATPase